MSYTVYEPVVVFKNGDSVHGAKVTDYERQEIVSSLSRQHGVLELKTASIGQSSTAFIRLDDVRYVRFIEHS